MLGSKTTSSAALLATLAVAGGCQIGCGSDSRSGSPEPDGQAPSQPGSGGTEELASGGGASGSAGVAGAAGLLDSCAAGGATGDALLTDCGDVCVNLQSDPAHCGACGHACQPGEQCELGVCVCPSGVSCNGICAPVDDVNNCGACGVVCPASQQCVDGSCQCAEAGLTLCAALCVDLTSSAQHCGACDSPCPAGAHCSSSQCTCDDASLLICNSACVDAETYAQQCGDCGGECSGQMQCIDSACRCPDPIVAAPIRLTDSTSDSSRPRAAWNGTHVAVAYFNGEEGDSSLMGRYGDVYVALLNPVATRALAQDIPVTRFYPSETERTGYVKYPPDIVWTGSEFGVVWAQVDTTNSSAAVYQLAFQRMAADGSLLGTQVILASGGRDMFAFPELSWNSVYGGYGVASLNMTTGEHELRLIGADGTASEAPLVFPPPMVMPSVPENGIPVLTPAPTGEWGLVQDSHIFVHLTQVSADGSQCSQPEDLAAPGFGEGVALLHDGTEWVAAWAESGVIPNSVFINRGATSNVPHELVPSVPLSLRTYEYLMLVQGPAAVLEIAWTQAPLEGTDIRHNFQMQRLMPPTDGSSEYTALTNIVDIVADDEVALFKTTDLVHTGGGTMMALWSGDFSGTYDIYAASIDLQACP